MDAVINSLLSLPKMLPLRPMIIDDQNELKAGNQRYKGLMAIAEMTIPELEDRISALNISDERKEEARSIFSQVTKSKKIPSSWVINASNFNSEELEELIIKDNLPYGEWDWSSLEQGWNIDDLESWGMDLPEWFPAGDFDPDEFFEDQKEDPDGPEKFKIILEYTEEDGEKVKDALSRIAASPEQAVWLLLKFDQEEE